MWRSYAVIFSNRGSVSSHIDRLSMNDRDEGSFRVREGKREPKILEKTCLGFGQCQKKRDRKKEKEKILF